MYRKYNGDQKVRVFDLVAMCSTQGQLFVNQMVTTAVPRLCAAIDCLWDEFVDRELSRIAVEDREGFVDSMFTTGFATIVLEGGHMLIAELVGEYPVLDHMRDESDD